MKRPLDLIAFGRGTAGSWARAREVALAILHRAELRRQHLAEAEARFYATEDER